MSMIAPRVITGAFGFDPNISSISILKVAFRTYDNKCFNTEFIRGYYTEFVSRYITNRGIIPSEVDVDGIVDSIIEIRNASFEAYAAILSFSRKYSCSKLRSITGDLNFGKAFSNDSVDTTRNVPTIANVLPNYDLQYTTFDYSDLKISRAIWMQDFQALYTDFYLTKSAVDHANDIFRDYIQLKQIGDVSIILDCFPEYCIGDYLNRIRMLHESCTQQFNKYPSLRGILTELNFINLRPICNEIHNDLSKTELRIKYDDGSFSNTVYNWPYTWLTSFDPNINWIEDDNYVPDPFNYGITLRKDVPTAPTLGGKVFEECNDLRRLLMLGKAQKPSDEKSKLYDSAISTLPESLSDIDTKEKIDNFNKAISDVFTDKPKDLFSPLIVAKYQEIINLIKTVKQEVITAGLPGKQLGLQVLNFSNRAMRTATSAPFVAAATTFGGPVLSAVRFASNAAYVFDTMKRDHPDLFKAPKEDLDRIKFPRKEDESDKDYMKRMKSDFKYRPQFTDASGLKVYSLKYLKDELFKVTDVVSEFDHSVSINEFANMDRFRFLRPTSHICIHLNRQGSSFTSTTSQIIINGVPNPDSSRYPDTVENAVNFSTIISNSHVYAPRNMFQADYTFSKQVNPVTLHNSDNNIYDPDWKTRYASLIDECLEIINNGTWNIMDLYFTNELKRLADQYDHSDPSITTYWFLFNLRITGEFSVNRTALSPIINRMIEADNIWIAHLNQFEGYKNRLAADTASFIKIINTEWNQLPTDDSSRGIVGHVITETNTYGTNNYKWCWDFYQKYTQNWQFTENEVFTSWYRTKFMDKWDSICAEVIKFAKDKEPPTPPQPKPIIGAPDYNFVLATCAMAGDDNSTITVNEDMNTVWIDQYQYYREISRMEFFHPNASEEIRKSLDNVHRYEPEVLKFK
jgi:hypothetical protein